MRLWSCFCAFLFVLCTIGFGVIPALADDNGRIPFFSHGPVLDEDIWYISHGWANGEHQSCEWRDNAIGQSDEGYLTLTLSGRGGKKRPIGCGEIQSKKRYGYGRYEARMRSAAGSGLNTAFFTFIGPPNGVAEHDEIDFEFLGKDPTIVQVVHYRDAKSPKPYIVDLGFDSSKEFHNYAFEWDKNEIRWYVDDKLVYKTQGKVPVPVHDQKIFFSLWSGAESMNDWLGRFHYKKPVTAEVQWVKFTPFPEGTKPQ